MIKQNRKFLPGVKVVRDVTFPVVYPTSRRPAMEVLSGLVKGGQVMASDVNIENIGHEHLELFKDAFFPRDAMYVSEMLQTVLPELLPRVLLESAKLQATKSDYRAEAEIGQIPHEVRNPSSEIAGRLTLERGWSWPYYGSVDNTPHFIALVAKHALGSNGNIDFLQESFLGVDGERRTILEAIDLALAWIAERRGCSLQGFVESKRMLPHSNPNQVWMDSPDAYFHADGSLPDPDNSVTSIEVQALTYDALVGASEIYEALGNHSRAQDLERQAEGLRASVFKNLWIENFNGGGFSLGGSRNGAGEFKPFLVRKSNIGHLLYSRILDNLSETRMVSSIVEVLMSDDMLAAAGIRTCSTKEVRFYPEAYHNGSVWPWDNYIIAQGLRKHGFIAQADDIEKRIIRIVEETKVYPEFAQGGVGAEVCLNEELVEVWDAGYNFKNTLIQLPQQIQAWTVAAVVAIEGRNS